MSSDSKEYLKQLVDHSFFIYTATLALSFLFFLLPESLSTDILR